MYWDRGRPRPTPAVSPDILSASEPSLTVGLPLCLRSAFIWGRWRPRSRGPLHLEPGRGLSFDSLFD
jgi:hypothetical protein